YRAPLLDPGVAISLSKHAVRAGLVHAPMEQELAAVIRIGVGRQHGPAGEHLRKAGDVLLRIGGAHAERMQLQNFAREILVETSAAIDARNRAGADRLRIVEI